LQSKWKYLQVKENFSIVDKKKDEQVEEMSHVGGKNEPKEVFW